MGPPTMVKGAIVPVPSQFEDAAVAMWSPLLDDSYCYCLDPIRPIRKRMPKLYQIISF